MAVLSNDLGLGVNGALWLVVVGFEGVHWRGLPLEQPLRASELERLSSNVAHLRSHSLTTQRGNT